MIRLSARNSHGFKSQRASCNPGQERNFLRDGSSFEATPQDDHGTYAMTLLIKHCLSQMIMVFVSGPHGFCLSQKTLFAVKDGEQLQSSVSDDNPQETDFLRQNPTRLAEQSVQTDIVVSDRWDSGFCREKRVIMSVPDDKDYLQFRLSQITVFKRGTLGRGSIAVGQDIGISLGLTWVVLSAETDRRRLPRRCCCCPQGLLQSYREVDVALAGAQVKRLRIFRGRVLKLLQNHRSTMASDI